VCMRWGTDWRVHSLSAQKELRMAETYDLTIWNCYV
jgi:hypothetical protein